MRFPPVVLACSFLLACPAADSGTPTDTASPDDSGVDTNTDSADDSADDSGIDSGVDSGDTDTGLANPDNDKTATIGPAGGSITLDNGITVTIPADALTEDVEIGVSWIFDETKVPPLPEWVEGPFTTGVDLTPHGTTFLKAVEVSMPAAAASEERVLLYAADESATEWQSEGSISQSGDRIIFSVWSFSRWSPATVAEGACPCWRGKDLPEFETVLGTNPMHSGFSYSAAYALAVVSGPSEPRLQTFGSPGLGVCSRDLEADGDTTPQIYAEPITWNEQLACHALLEARFKRHERTNLNVAAFATGIPAGDSAGLLVTLTSPTGTVSTETFTLLPDQELAWSAASFESGTTMSAEMAWQPLSVRCTVAPPPALGSTNYAIPVVCSTLPGACPCYNAVDIADAYQSAISTGGQPGVFPTNDYAGCTYLKDGGDHSQNWGDPEKENRVFVAAGTAVGSFDLYARMYVAGTLDGITLCGDWDPNTTPGGEYTTLTLAEAQVCADELEVFRSNPSAHGAWPTTGTVTNGCYELEAP